MPCLQGLPGTTVLGDQKKADAKDADKKAAPAGKKKG